MPIRSDTSLAALLLTQRLVEAPAPPLKASEYWSLLDAVPDPGSLLGLDAAGVASTSGLDEAEAERVARLLDAATAFAFELDAMEQSGLRVVASVDDDYPGTLVARLGRGAPPLLYVAGDPGLLAGELLGVVGSRDVGKEGAEAAIAVSREAAAQGFGIVSGGARGVDRLAMQAALDAGAVVCGVLAESLVRATREAEVRQGITDGRICFCTPYKPSAGFSVANAMGRNKLIYALSQATFVVAADAGTGGTWAGAVEALRRRTAPVLVWTGEGSGPGNRRLVEAGAMAVEAVGDVFPLPVGPPAERAAEPASQLVLDI